MIAWQYIDKTAATIAALRDYDSMCGIISDTPEEIREAYEDITAPHSPNLTGLPPAKNPQAGADRMVNQLIRLDVLQERYRSADEYMAWFEPAWNSLTDTEQTVLREFYMSGSQRSGANARLQNRLSYSERQIERFRQNGLSRMTLLLFGK